MDQGSNSRKSKLFYGYVIVLLSSYMMMAIVGTHYSFGVFLGPILEEFGWTRALTSGAYSLRVLLICCSGFVAGRLNDRLGPRFILTAAGLFSGLSYLLMSQTSAAWQVYLFVGLMGGIGIGSTITPLLSTIPRWFVKRRGMAMGLSLATCGLGSMIIPPVATQLTESYGWRFTFVIIGSVILISVTIAAQFLKRDPSQTGQMPYGGDKVMPESSELQHRKVSLQEIVRTRQFWALGGIYACVYSCNGTISLHIAINATDIGISAINAASVLAVIGGAGVAGRIVMGVVADRIGNKRALICGFLLMSVSLIWLLIAHEIWMFHLFAIVFGFAYGNLVVLESPLAADLFGLGSLGILIGGVEFVSCGLSAPSTVIAGYIYDITNSYQLAFLLTTLVSVTGTMLALSLSRIKG